MALFGGQNGLMRPGIAAAEPQNALAPRPTAADAYDTNAHAVERWLTEQQQISADRGLWQGGSVLDGGHPTAAGAVDAAGQYTNALMMGTTAPGIRAYHASPHSFERFDTSKIGTGEGNQAYGHGLYAAESPAVSGGGGQYDMQFTARNLGKSDLNQQETSILQGLRDGKSELDLLREQARMGASFDEAQAAIDRVKAAKAHIYEVNIAANPEHMLHWDKPLSEQHPVVQEALKRTPYPPHDMRMSPRQYLAELETNREGVSRTGDPAALAAQALREAGIPGIRYLDQGSRGAGAGSHNYVVFDAATLDILRKYGLAGLMLGGGAAAGAQGSGE